MGSLGEERGHVGGNKFGENRRIKGLKGLTQCKQVCSLPHLAVSCSLSAQSVRVPVKLRALLGKERDLACAVEMQALAPEARQAGPVCLWWQQPARGSDGWQRSGWTSQPVGEVVCVSEGLDLLASCQKECGVCGCLCGSCLEVCSTCDGV